MKIGINKTCRECVRRKTVDILVTAFLLLAGAADAATLAVDDSGGANFTRIQDAIDDASIGDTIFVHNGTYFEQISITKNNLSIIGEDRNTTIIHGGWSADRVVDIEADNVYFSGLTVANSSEFGTGVYLQNASNLTIINNIIKYNFYSIQLNNSNHNVIESNNISGREYNGYGDIVVSSSSNNTFAGNSGGSIKISDYSNNNKFESNKLQGILIGSSTSFYTGSDTSIYTSTGINSNKNIIRNNEVQSLNIYDSNGNIIDGNNFSGRYYGNGDIAIYSSNNTIISNNTVLSNIAIYSSNNNIISSNTIPSGAGLSLSSSSNNSVYSNNITGTTVGIYIRSSSKNNTISNNIIQSASQYSIYIIWSGGNRVYLNTFNSARNAFNFNGFNSWDNGKVGNYWSDYNGSDNNSDGIGDTPYLKIETNAGAMDNHPLIAPPCNCTLLPYPSPFPIPTPAPPSPGNVTRSIKPFVVQPNGTVNITLTPSDPELFGLGYMVVETFPQGFTYVRTSADSTSNKGFNTYSFTRLGSSHFNYTLTAPPANGTYTINGTFRDEDKRSGNVSGTTVIRVGGVNYDFDGNGKIDRSEAVKAVMDYSSGIIVRQDAIEMVIAFLGG